MAEEHPLQGREGLQLLHAVQAVPPYVELSEGPEAGQVLHQSYLIAWHDTILCVVVCYVMVCCQMVTYWGDDGEDETEPSDRINTGTSGDDSQNRTKQWLRLFRSLVFISSEY